MCLLLRVQGLLAYEVTVYTSDIRGAGTDANVSIELHGAKVGHLHWATRPIPWDAAAGQQPLRCQTGALPARGVHAGLEKPWLLLLGP
jgi:hypothetical protein